MPDAGSRAIPGGPGGTWEQRWLASGADAAPRAWAQQLQEQGRVTRASDGQGALSALVIARVIRPSYSFLVCTLFRDLPQRFSLFNDAELFGRMRELASYSSQVPRLQLDAETCLVRVMIRTGKPLSAVTGDEGLPTPSSCERLAGSGVSIWRGS
ncbi:hypothetical protein [Nocardia salmonicida]|uniref:hypothetical protein n=1 Tax=Nocardia salmonicida TaxID=53431 RepID=UPI000AA53333|nr:hypothetical protein [Nocardia salmonicida]